MDVNQLSNMPGIKMYQAGETIVNEGEQTINEMYIVLAGKVDMVKDYRQPGQAIITSLSPGDFFGESSLFLNKPHTETAVSQDMAMVLPLNQTNIDNFFAKQPDATYSIIQTLCSRITSPAAASSGVASAQAPKKTVTAVTAPGLFPDGHKQYDFEIKPPPSNAVFNKSFSCPVCEHKFSAPVARPQNLRLDKMDKDFRLHYKEDMDVIHYDIITCPQCYYSNFGTSFNDTVMPKMQENVGKVKCFKDSLNLPLDGSKEINYVFSQFYLALKSAPAFFLRHEMMVARIWLRLLWLYQDCQDSEMENYAAQNAKDAYLDAYQNSDISAEAMQQISLTIAELSLKLNDISTAKKFFFQAKGVRPGKPLLTQQADDRLNEIRQLEKTEKE